MQTHSVGAAMFDGSGHAVYDRIVFVVVEVTSKSAKAAQNEFLPFVIILVSNKKSTGLFILKLNSDVFCALFAQN